MQASFTQADFDSSGVLSNLNNLGLPRANYPASFTVGIATFTTDDRQVRYANFGINNSFALGDNTDLGFIPRSKSQDQLRGKRKGAEGATPRGRCLLYKKKLQTLGPPSRC